MSTPLDELRQIVSTCTACRLHKDRKQTVFDRGNPSAPLMIVGGAPGEEEDASGSAFVGKAGRHLTQLLRAARVPDDGYYCCNVLKCRSADNRFPDKGEPEVCRNYLVRQVKEVNPKAVLVMGKEALKYLLLWDTHEEIEPLFQWINRIFRRRDLYGEAIFLVCYHPSYLLKTEIPEDEEAWVQAVAQMWAYVEHKLAGTPPAPLSFGEIRSAPIVPRQGRNLFGTDRGRVL
jgi:uracil-DNA glycosylase